VHQEALDKVMHGSVNKYFDVTPIGRVLQKFNGEIQVFKAGLMNSFQIIFKLVMKAAFQFSFLVTVSNWTLVMITAVFILISRMHFFFRRAIKRLNRLERAQLSPSFSFI